MGALKINGVLFLIGWAVTIGPLFYTVNRRLAALEDRLASLERRMEKWPHP
jgi:hypothetical protein